MKQVIIIIRPQNYYETKAALINERFFSMTVKDVYGRGKKAVQFTYSNSENGRIDEPISDSLVLKKRMDIYIRDEDEERLINVVKKINGKNNAGDGKIFVLPMDTCVRIHTGERDEDSLL